jgi:hypothetical protein
MKVKSNILVIIVLALSGCATKIVGIYNYSAINKTPATYFVRPPGEYASLSIDNQRIDSLIQTVISKSLELKGLRPSSLPDLYVSYIINVHTSSETRQDNYNPYNRYRYNYNYYYNYSTSNYKEGVLIIDIKNDDKILVWQGSKTFKIRSKQSVEELLPEICREIMTAYNIDARQ